MYCLLEVVSVCPQKLAPKFVDKIDWIKVSSVPLPRPHAVPSRTSLISSFVSPMQGLMNTNKEEMRELAAQLYAVVVSTMSGNELKTAVQNLVKITKDAHVRFFC